MSSSGQENTEKYQNEQLNEARIDSPSFLSTPSTKQLNSKKSTSFVKRVFWDDCDSSEEQEWRILLTKSIKKAERESTPQKASIATQSVKKQLQNTAQMHNEKSHQKDRVCPICLNQFNSIRGSLQCLHQFCYECISQWTKTSTVCPCCRKQYVSILKLIGSTTKKNIKQTERIPVEKKQLVFMSQYDHYTCYQCGNGDNQHVLLICDQCDFYSCHVYCDATLNNRIPSGNWYCIYCRQNHPESEDNQVVRAERNNESQKVEEEDEEEQDSSSQETGDGETIAYRTRSRDSILTNQRSRSRF